jgi:hypothetical protein
VALLVEAERGGFVKLVSRIFYENRARGCVIVDSWLACVPARGHV